ncbi:MAG: Short-chain dehydrogenase [Sphingomonas bacterium]|nr:Short-chain dehydrogenase [Sphingomonas bacterium]
MLNGKVATVTGAGQGMGAAIARRYAAEGASVLVSDLDLARAESVVESIRAAGGRADAVRANVTNAEDAQRLVATAMDLHGKLDIHVNNAGVSTTKLFLDTTVADFKLNYDVNLIGAFLCGQAAARVMKEQGGGRIINITSLSGQRGGVGRGAYGASKAALELLTKVMSVELAGWGINTNGIAPGAIKSAMSDEHHDAATRAAYTYLIPQRRYGLPDEIADAALFLASDMASHICGHILNVDGGYLTAGLMFEMGDYTLPGPPRLKEQVA